MYSNKKNVLQLVALLKEYGIYQVVISPGSRNSPITHSLANDPFFMCHSVVDERSAGFYALGIILCTGEPAAVCCTSGTAVLNLAPAVAEAYYQKLPLIVITADRPQAWIGQMAGQTIPQPGVFNTLVKKAVQLPEIKDADSQVEEWYCNRLINEALTESQRHSAGPVHINIPLSEPLFEYTVPELPKVRVIKHYGDTDISEDDLADFGDRFHQYKKRMILVGQSHPLDIPPEALNLLASVHDCAILAEHLANIRPSKCISNFDAILYALPKDRWGTYSPDLLITVGGHIVSKRVKEFLRKHPPMEHWHISPDGEIIDLYQSTTDIIETSPSIFIDYIASLDNPKPDKRKEYSFLWNEAQLEYQALQTIDYSDMSAVKALLDALPDNAVLHLANSSSIRLAQLFPRVNTNIPVFGNRGTSGIDGCVSTAVGYAAVSGQLTFLLTGDLAFFYDMNGLWNRQINKNLRILLNNNGGGEIFYALPGLNRSEALEDFISASHPADAKGWAETMGFYYIPARNEKELAGNMPTFVSDQSEKPILMEVFTTKEKNTKILRDYYHALKKN